MSSKKSKAYRSFIDGCRIDLTNEKKSSKRNDFLLSDYRRIVRKYDRDVLYFLFFAENIDDPKVFCDKNHYLIDNFFFQERGPIVVDGILIKEVHEIGYINWVSLPNLFRCIIARFPRKDPFTTLLQLISQRYSYHRDTINNNNIDLYEEGFTWLIEKPINTLDTVIIVNNLFQRWATCGMNVVVSLLKIVLTYGTISDYVSTCLAVNMEFWDNIDQLHLLTTIRIQNGHIPLIYCHGLWMPRVSRVPGFQIKSYIYKELWVMIEALKQQFICYCGYYEKFLIRQIVTTFINYYE